MLQISDVLKESLLVKETPVAVKVARLYLLSDILHNSAAPVKHAPHYRYESRVVCVCVCVCVLGCVCVC